MGLSASMWTSVSGLLAHGNKMNVVGNNIANVSTIGFKGQRMDFNDYLYLNGGSTSGPTQIGAGVSTYAVLGDFSQGSLESTNSVTDLAIDGEGFFKVRQPNSQQMYYTRAGDFYFNSDRQLQNPEGLRLQGWKVEGATNNISFKNDSVNLGSNKENESPYKGVGTPRDIVLDSWNLQPLRTSSVSMVMGLTNKEGYDRMTSGEKPLTSLFDQWDGRNQANPLPNNSYAASSSIKVYDESGTAHEITAYFDQVATDSKKYKLDGLPAGSTVYEYIITMNPAEDNRTFGGTKYNAETNKFEGIQPTSLQDTKAAGMLMSGHLIFDAGGNLINQTAYTYGGDPLGNNESVHMVDSTSGNSVVKVKKNGTIEITDPAYTSTAVTGVPGTYTISKNGTAVGTVDTRGLALIPPTLPTLTVNAAGVAANLKATEPGKEPGAGNQYDGNPEDLSSWQSTRLSSNGLPAFCANFTGQPLANSVRETDGNNPPQAQNFMMDFNFGLRNLGGDPKDWKGSYTSMDQLHADAKGIINYTEIAKFSSTDADPDATKTISGSSVTQDAKQNGYTYGVLSGTNITNDGVVYGYYDNGETVALYQIALYDFHNKQGLRREGGNLYAQTKESGEARQGVAGDNGFGATRAYNIEGSNVDMSREFVNMITTQRGFQANSKGITTVDTMLETVIGMKR